MVKKLQKLRVKTMVWWIVSLTSFFVMLAGFVCANVAWIIDNDNLGAISTAIFLPLLFGIGFIIGHWAKLNSKKEAAKYCVINPNQKSQPFYQLLEKYLHGKIKQDLSALELKKIEICLCVQKDKNIHLSISGKKENFCIDIEFNEMDFSFRVNFDEEEKEIVVNYPSTDKFIDLIELVSNEINKEIKSKVSKLKEEQVERKP